MGPKPILLYTFVFFVQTLKYKYKENFVHFVVNRDHSYKK